MVANPVLAPVAQTLEQTIKEFKRKCFGLRSERLDADQMDQALEDTETATTEIEWRQTMA